MASDIKTAVFSGTVDTTKTSGQTEDFTIPGLGWTPSFALITIVNNAADPINGDIYARVSNAAASSGPNSWNTAWFMRDNEANSDIRRYGENAQITRLRGNFLGANTILQLSFNSFIANGIRLAHDVTPDANDPVEILIVFFGGADLSALASYVGLGTGTSAIDINTIGFEPTLVGSFGFGDDLNGSYGSFFTQSFGFSSNQASVSTAALIQENTSSAAQGSPEARLYDDSTIVKQGVTSGGYSVAISDFDANGFSITPSAGANNDDFPYWALDTGDRGTFVGLIDSPTSAAVDWAVTDIGFKPQLVILIPTMIPATGANYVDDRAGAWGLAAFDADGREASVHHWDEDNASIINVGTDLVAKGLYLREDDGSTVAFDASNPTMTSAGFTFAAADIAAANATGRKFICIAIEEVAAGGTPVSKDGTLGVEHGLELSQAGPFAIEHLLDLTADEEIAIERVARLVADGGLAVEHGLSVIRVGTLAVEHLLDLALVAPVLAERGQLVAVLRALNLDHAAVISGAGALSVGFTAPVSILGTLGLDHALVVRQADTLPMEHLATVAGEAVLHLEHAGDLIIEALGTLPLEHLASVRADAALSTEHTRVLITDQTLPMEITAAVEVAEAVLVEHLARVFGEDALPTEWTQVIVVDGAIPVEWDGQASFIEGVAHRFRKGRRGRVFGARGRVRLFPGRRNRTLN